MIRYSDTKVTDKHYGYTDCMKNTIIYLLGHEGVGKYTIGKALAALTGAKLVDNHSINNPIFSVIHTDGKNTLPSGVWHRVRQIRAAVFETIATLSPPEYSFIFTNASTGRPKDIVVYNQILEIATLRSSLFVVVRLACSTEEITKRIVRDDRKARYKSINAVAAKYRNENEEVYSPPHEHVFDLDVSTLSPETAAKEIVNFVKECRKASVF